MHFASKLGRRVAVALVAVALSPGAGSPSPLTPLVSVIAPQIDADHAMDTMRNVYATDRWFTFPKFEQTAAYLKQRLEQSGLKEVEIGGARADGVTQAGFWTMPLAWDARSARLEVTSPERIELCDYEKVPASLGMWSGSTPAGGIDAELVDIKTTPWPQVKGKLVLTDKNSAGLKHNLVKYGALGAVNGFSENPDLRDGRQWVNAWGDQGWGFIKTSTPLLSYSITPRQAERLRSMIAAGQKIKVHAVADTRYYEGRYPWVTGLLPGTTSEEVLVLGHTSEQGAQDNATGVSAMVEALSTISRLIESGKLSRPQRGIRILLMPEMYGSLSYISQNPDRMKRTVAAMTVDAPAASYDLAGTEYTFYLNPHVAMSYVDALVLRIAGAYLGSRPWHWKEHMTGTDAYLGEPTVDVPDAWPYSGTGPVTHHNSEDKPETVDPRSLRDLSGLIATYAYFNATAGEAQMRWLAEITLDQSIDRIRAAASDSMDGILSGHPEQGSYGLQRVRYFAERGREAVASVLRVVPQDRREQAKSTLASIFAEIDSFRDAQLARLKAAGAKESPEHIPANAQRIVVKRKRIGSIPMDELPEEQWEGYPSGAWDKLVTVALYWCDGKRNLAEAIHLTEMEMGPSKFDFVGYFRFLERRGYVEFAR